MEEFRTQVPNSYTERMKDTLKHWICHHRPLNGVAILHSALPYWGPWMSRQWLKHEQTTVVEEFFFFKAAFVKGRIPCYSLSKKRIGSVYGKTENRQKCKDQTDITHPLHDGAPLVSLIDSTLKFQCNTKLTITYPLREGHLLSHLGQFQWGVSSHGYLDCELGSRVRGVSWWWHFSHIPWHSPFSLQPHQQI